MKVRRIGSTFPVVWFRPVSNRHGAEPKDVLSPFENPELPEGRVPRAEDLKTYLSLARADPDEKVHVRVGKLKYDFDEADPPDIDADPGAFTAMSGVDWDQVEAGDQVGESPARLITVRELEVLIGCPVSNRMLALASRTVRARRMRMGHDGVTLPDTDASGESYSDSPRFRGSLRAFAGYAAQYVTKLGPELKDQRHRGGYALIEGSKDLLGSAARLLTTARQWNPRGSPSPYQTLRQALPRPSALHESMIDEWHKMLFKKAVLLKSSPDYRRPHGYPKDSNGSTWLYWHAALKGILTSWHIERGSTIAAVAALARDDRSEANHQLRVDAELGCVIAAQDGDRQQMRTDVDLFGAADGLPEAVPRPRKSPRMNFDSEQRLGLIETTFAALTAEGEPYDEITSKSRNIEMVGAVPNQLFLLAHKPHYAWLYEPVAAGFKSLGPGKLGRAPRGRVWIVRRWDVRRMDHQLPLWAAYLQSVSRVRHGGYPLYPCIMRLLIYMMPRFLKADRIGRSGMTVLGRCNDVDTFSWYCGMPTGVGDGSDTHSETTPMDIGARCQVEFDIGPATAAEMLYHLLTSGLGGTILRLRGDGIEVEGPATTFTTRLCNAISRPTDGRFILDYAPADDASFDGEMPARYCPPDDEDGLTTEGIWIRDYLAIWYRLAHGERPLRLSKCPGQSIERRLEHLLTSKSGSDLLAAYNRCFTWLWNGTIEGAGKALRATVDALQLELTELEQRVVDDPSQLGRYSDDIQLLAAIRPEVLALIYVSLSIDACERFRRKAAAIRGQIPRIGDLYV